ncbi:MAG: RHS repeat-associated core domain-containing protein, partial [bacterium]|nr:RHS repeat-associated core domain-containing protein [bacterium]
DVFTHETDHLYGPDGQAFAVQANAGLPVKFLAADHLGTVRLITNHLGILIGRRDYYPFGQELYRENQSDDRMHKFTGHERDYSNQTDYMLGRTYLYPKFRFASPDPARDGWNLYAYARNNPVNLVDPDGREARVYRGGIVVDHGLLSDRIVYWGENATEFAADYNRRRTVAGVLATLGVVMGIVDSGDEEEKPFLPDDYYKSKEEDSAPGQATPYHTYERFDEQGNLKQVTTYDESGDRAHQYDVGKGTRHGEGQHDFEYDAKDSRQKPGGGRRSDHLPWKEREDDRGSDPD